MKYFTIILFSILLSRCGAGRETDSLITVTYSVEEINNEVLLITFFIKNNDSIDYFIPFIKPARQYVKVSDDNNSKGIQVKIPIDYYLKEKILTKEDFRNTAELDSLVFNEEKDTLFFFFEDPVAKIHYDSILTNYKNKRELRQIYPYFYHAIGNACIYINKGESKSIACYVRHYYPVKIDDLKVDFYFNTDSVPEYKMKWFNAIPEKIENYYLFNGIIKSAKDGIGILK